VVRVKRFPERVIRFPRTTDPLLALLEPLRHPGKSIHSLRGALRSSGKRLRTHLRTVPHARPIRSTRAAEVDLSRRDPLHSDAKPLRCRANSIFVATEPLHSDEKPLLTLHRSTLLRAGTAVSAPTRGISRSAGPVCGRSPREGALAGRILPCRPLPHPAGVPEMVLLSSIHRHRYLAMASWRSRSSPAKTVSLIPKSGSTLTPSPPAPPGSASAPRGVRRLLDAVPCCRLEDEASAGDLLPDGTEPARATCSPTRPSRKTAD
jgi:hypothetical protein